jgi:hypothetical protein
MLDHPIGNAPRKGFGWQVFSGAYSRPTFDPDNLARIIEYILAPTQNPKTPFSAQRTTLVPFSSQVSS